MGLDRDPARRDRLAAVLAGLGVRLYLCGHEHLYAHRLIATPAGAIHQVTLGGGGATTYPLMTPDVVASESARHVGMLIAEDGGLELSALGLDGRVLDVVSLPAAHR
jgi:hypothetical protein